MLFSFSEVVVGCNYEARVKLEAYNPDVDRLGEKSNYQIEEGFREFDNLLLKELDIVAQGGCSNDSITIDIFLETPKGKKIALIPSPYIKFISNLRDKEKYTFECLGYIKNTADYSCRDSYNKSYELKAVRISEAGLWEGKVKIAREESKIFYEIPVQGNTLIFPSKKRNVQYLEPFEFLVISRTEAVSLDLAESNNNLATFAIGIAVIAISLQSLFFFLETRRKRNEEFKRQVYNIQTIEDLIGIIKKTIGSYKEEIKQRQIPSYFILEIPEELYVSSLKPLFMKTPTKEIKENIVLVNQKIREINNLIVLSQNENSLNHTSYIFDSTITKNTYLDDLIKLLKKVKEKIEKNNFNFYEKPKKLKDKIGYWLSGYI